MSHWNYRILKDEWPAIRPDNPQAPFTTGTSYELIEVYYTDDGKIDGWCEASVNGFESLDDFKAEVQNMLKAFDQPVLSDSDVNRDDPSPPRGVKFKT